MGQISSKLRKWTNPANGDEGLSYWCQGCDSWHTIKTKGDGAWGWNGDVQRPTFTPSVLLNSKRMTEKGNADHAAWVDAGCPPRNGDPFDSVPYVCHFFVTNGRVQFLGDCTHALAGQTVDLPDLPEEWRG
ncbi:MAG: ammonia monooxygenase [Bradyrhizobium sp.]|nr:ammonia monooxygenase [Bradyrhizobium sp.]